MASAPGWCSCWYEWGASVKKETLLRLLVQERKAYRHLVQPVLLRIMPFIEKVVCATSVLCKSRK